MNKYKYGIVAILLVALLLRVANIYNAMYGTTQELFRDMNVLYDFFYHHQVILLGPSASLGGFNFGAMYYYLLAPFVYLFRMAPYGALMAGAITSVASVYVLYRLLWLWSGTQQLALLGAGLMAISLYDIQNSYYISNPNFMPLFVLLVLLLATQILRGKNSWWMSLLCGLCFGIAVQLHATALLILPVVLLVIGIKFRSRVTIKTLAWFGLGWLAMFAPYIIYELQHQFINTLGIIRLGGDNFGWLPRFESAVSLGTFWVSTIFFKNIFFNIYEQSLIVTIILLIGVCLAVLAIWYMMRGEWRQGMANFLIPKDGIWFLSTWFAVGTVVFLFFNHTIQSFYFLIFWPMPIIVLAGLLYAVWTRYRTLAIVGISIFALTQIIQGGYFFHYIYHPELNDRAIKSIFSSIHDRSDNQPYRVINTTEHTNLFVFYDKLTGANSQSRIGAAYIFFVAKQDEDPLIPRQYQEKERFNSGAFKIIKTTRAE